MSPLLLALLIILLLGARKSAAAEVIAGSGDRILHVDVQRRADTILIGGPPVRYILSDLEPRKGYEVRVSFPGTAGVRIALHLDPSSRRDGGGSGGQQRRRRRGRSSTRRSLLDAEKVMFRTDDDGHVGLHGQHAPLSPVVVLLKAETWVRWQQPDQAPQELTYNIVLERSILGVPHSALPLLATALALVLLAAAAVPWWGDKAVPAILRWLNGSGASQAAPDASLVEAARPARRRRAATAQQHQHGTPRQC
ncbi:hypothetical protein D9Q98_004949 [Chlorella vulgaris]|uniref:Uncharacterized protein n=1 Tax=Chlorella vulgaris TaxID=3077 RepID=A0A9D4TPH9_CHLVU|nr:hypothetical protein D9Q98_004949 [Chlorella vulgaris]